LWRGSIERGSGLVISGQDQLNLLTGNMLALANSEFPDVEIPLAGDYRFIDIAPQRRVTLTLDESETYRGYVWNKKKFIPQSMTFNYEPSRQSLLTDLEVREETHATEKADTILIPEDPPYTNYKLPEWSIEFPPFIPPQPLWPPVDPPPAGIGSLVYAVWEFKLYRTRDFWETSPTWELVLSPGDLGETQFTGFRLDPSDPINSAMLITSSKIWYTSTLNADTPTWGLVYSAALYPSHLVSSISHIQPWIAGRGWSAAAWKTGAFPALYHARGTAGGGSWTAHQIGMPVTHSYAAPSWVQPSTYAGGVLHFGGGFKTFYSIDAGTSFILNWDVPPEARVLQPMAHLGNSDGRTIYFTHRPPAGNILLRVSTDYGYTSASISPLYDGAYWFPKIHEGGANNGQSAENFWIHPVTGVAYAALRGNGRGYGIFGQYANGGWQIKAQFSGIVGPSMINFGDDGAKHYLMGVPAGERIMGSEDYGSTWHDKEGNINFIGLGVRVCIQVVWTV
jgi:hypothetical protein